MAQKRMLDKKISLSEQVDNLSVQAALLFTWSIPHSDDVGILPRSHRTLRAAIVPMWEFAQKEFDAFIDEIIGQGLWKELEYKGEQFYIITKFQDHQTLKKDRQPQTRLPITHSANPKETWNTLNSILEQCGIQVEDIGFQKDTEVKGSKVKGSKKKNTSKEVETLFEDFWSEYPRKIAKKKAKDAWLKINPDSKLFKEIMAGLQRAKQTPQWSKDGGQFIPHATTWLNQERWTDETEASVSRKTDQI